MNTWRLRNLFASTLVAVLTLAQMAPVDGAEHQRGRSGETERRSTDARSTKESSGSGQSARREKECAPEARRPNEASEQANRRQKEGALQVDRTRGAADRSNQQRREAAAKSRYGSEPAPRNSVSIVAKDGTSISGFTKHGVDRAIGDGAKRAGTRPEAIRDAVQNPVKISEGIDSRGRPVKVYTGERTRVVVNPETGRIISTNPLSRSGASPS